MPEPRSGFRVVEMALALQGPAAAMFLGDMGAEVVKAEAQGAQFIAAKRGKKSLNLDADSEAGREAILRRLDSADVLRATGTVQPRLKHCRNFDRSGGGSLGSPTRAPAPVQPLRRTVPPVPEVPRVR
jgi:hypothetical protein